MRWHRILARQGWVAPAWPKEWGGTGWNVVQRYIFEEELGYAGAADHSLRHQHVRAGAARLRHRGAEKALPAAHLQRRRFLVPGLFRAGLGQRPRFPQDKAEEEDHYVVNGQKTWTSYAHYADWIFCLVRTDPTVEKRQEGISFLLMDMRSPGITVRPLILMDGFHAVNEVFFDDVKVPLENPCTRRTRAGRSRSTCSATSA